MTRPVTTVNCATLAILAMHSPDLAVSNIFSWPILCIFNVFQSIIVIFIRPPCVHRLQRCACYRCSMVRLSLCLPVCLSVCLPVCLSVRLSVSLPTCLSVCLSACVSVRPSVCLSFGHNSLQKRLNQLDCGLRCAQETIY